MLEQVKDAITATPLPAPMSENDLGWIRWTFAGGLRGPDASARMVAGDGLFDGPPGLPGPAATAQ